MSYQENIQVPLHMSQIDCSNIIFTKSKANQNKKIVLIQYNDDGRNKDLVFQTPSLQVIGEPVVMNGYSEIEFALIAKDENKVNKLMNFFMSLEEQIKKSAQYNASSWFNLNENNRTINFQKIIRESPIYKNGVLKLKIIKNNTFETRLELNNSKTINVESIPISGWGKVILEVHAVWINSNNDFGVFFKPYLMSFEQKKTNNWKFNDDSENEDDEFLIPDTEINQNIFMNLDSNNDKSNDIKYVMNETTSQLEINELIKNLDTDLESDSDAENISEINLIKKDNIQDLLNININNFSSSTSSDESDSPLDDFKEPNNDENNVHIDAETSD